MSRRRSWGPLLGAALRERFGDGSHTWRVKEFPLAWRIVEILDAAGIDPYPTLASLAAPPDLLERADLPRAPNNPPRWLVSCGARGAFVVGSEEQRRLLYDQLGPWTAGEWGWPWWFAEE